MSWRRLQVLLKTNIRILIIRINVKESLLDHRSERDGGQKMEQEEDASFTFSCHWNFGFPDLAYLLALPLQY